MRTSENVRREWSRREHAVRLPSRESRRRRGRRPCS
jgi:hypothetical protein